MRRFEAPPLTMGFRGLRGLVFFFRASRFRGFGILGFRGLGVLGFLGVTVWEVWVVGVSRFRRFGFLGLRGLGGLRSWCVEV